AGLRYYYRLAAFDDPTSDSFSQAVSRSSAFSRQTAGSFDIDVVGVRTKEHHHAAHKAVMILEHFENAVEGRLLVERARERLPVFDKRREIFFFIVSISACQ